MEERKFKVGDRVEAIHDNGSIKCGYRGVVIDTEMNSICVEFEKYVCGHSCSGKGKTGHCWWVSNYAMKLVEPEKPTFKVGDRVVGVGEHDGITIDGLVGTIINDRQNHGYCGVEFDKDIDGHSCFGRGKYGHCWNVDTNKLKPYSNDWKVVIIPEGDKTLGRLYENGKVVKSVETKKHPDDEYSVETATKVIMERLFPNPKYHIEPYLGIWCETEEECETLKLELDKRGYTWNGGTSLITDVDCHKPKCRYHLRPDKRVTGTRNKDYKHSLNGKEFTDIDFKDLSFDDIVESVKPVEPKEPPFKVGDVIEMLEEFLTVPKGARGEVIKLEGDTKLVIDFKFEYPGTHRCAMWLSEPLPKSTGLVVNTTDLKKVN